jgi:nicotinamide-nucleotide amidase
VIAYNNTVKQQMLGVTADSLANSGAVSATVAAQMAQGIQQRLGTTWGLSITGIAGPGGATATKAVGLVYIGLAGPNAFCRAEAYRFGDRDRDWIRDVAAGTALDQLRRQLLATPE